MAAQLAAPRTENRAVPAATAEPLQVGDSGSSDSRPPQGGVPVDSPHVHHTESRWELHKFDYSSATLLPALLHKMLDDDEIAERPGLNWLNAAGLIEYTMTYRHFVLNVHRIARHLQKEVPALNVSPSSVATDEERPRVMLCFPFGLEFFTTFISVMMLGGIPVPAYPPSPHQLESGTSHLRSIMMATQPAAILTTGDYNKWRKLSSILHPSVWRMPTTKGRSVPWLVVGLDHSETAAPAGSNTGIAANGPNYTAIKEWLLTSPCAQFDAKHPAGDRIAFLQFTSGSTGEPKGVIITMCNILDNISSLSSFTTISDSQVPSAKAKSQSHDRSPAAGSDVQQQAKAVSVARSFSFLPPYHDFGLIAMHFTPLFCCMIGYFMSPFDFITDPLIFIDVLSRYRINLTGTPNFGLALCARRLHEKLSPKSEQKRAQRMLDWNLQSMRKIFSGAEPIQRQVVETFFEVFGAYGLSSAGFVPGYGMAECVFFACCHLEVTDGSVLRWSAKLPRLISLSNDVRACHFGATIKIVNSDTGNEVPDEEIGEIWIHSASKAAGYWGKLGDPMVQNVFNGKLHHCQWCASSTCEHCQLTYLRSGDEGFVEQGYLYLCGRIKDVIIMRGKKFHAPDIEYAAQDAHANIRPGCLAAFNAGPDSWVAPDDEEALVIVCEVRKELKRKEQYAAMCDAIVTAVTTKAGITPSVVLLIPPRTIAKTTSGKIKRRESRKRVKEKQYNFLYTHTSTTVAAPLTDSKKVHVDDLAMRDMPLPSQPPQPLQQQQHVIIVGAGVSGLQAGLQLLERGKKVTILERNEAVGGKLKKFIIDHEAYDVGPVNVMVNREGTFTLTNQYLREFGLLLNSSTSSLPDSGKILLDTYALSGECAYRCADTDGPAHTDWTPITSAAQRKLQQLQQQYFPAGDRVGFWRFDTPAPAMGAAAVNAATSPAFASIPTFLEELDELAVLMTNVGSGVRRVSTSRIRRSSTAFGRGSFDVGLPGRVYSSDDGRRSFPASGGPMQSLAAEDQEDGTVITSTNFGSASRGRGPRDSVESSVAHRRSSIDVINSLSLLSANSGPLLCYTLSGFGHCHDDDIPAMYLIKFFNVMGYMDPRTLALEKAGKAAASLQNGYQALAAAMERKFVELGGTLVKGASVERIERDSSTGVILSANRGINTTSSQQEQYTADKLIITAPSPRMLSLFANPTAAETALLSSIKFVPFCTFLLEFRKETFPSLPQSHGGTRGATLFHHLDMTKIDVGHAISYLQPTRAPILVVYAYRDRSRQASARDMVPTMVEDLRRVAPFQHVELVKVHTAEDWDYMPHYSSEHLRAGFMSKFEAIQGENNTLWCGSLFNGELIEANLQYAKAMVERYFPDPALEDPGHAARRVAANLNGKEAHRVNVNSEHDSDALPPSSTTNTGRPRRRHSQLVVHTALHDILREHLHPEALQASDTTINADGLPTTPIAALGVDSVGIQAIRSKIQDEFDVDIPWIQLASLSPADIADLIASSGAQDVGLGQKPEYQVPHDPTRIPQRDDAAHEASVAATVLWRFAIETLIILYICLLLAVCALPAYHFVNEVSTLPEPWSLITLGTSKTPNAIFGVLTILAIPIWVLTYTLAVVLHKWLIIGRYRTQRIALFSWAFYRWWFVDKLMVVWEMGIGNIIQKTVLLNWFYMLMGARVDWRVKFSAFVREFDLVTIGAFASIDGMVMCRMFLNDAGTQDASLHAPRGKGVTGHSQAGRATRNMPSINELNEDTKSAGGAAHSELGAAQFAIPDMVFLPVSIGPFSSIESGAVVPPGCVIGTHCTVDLLCALRECSNLPDGTTARSNPAVLSEPRNSAATVSKHQAFLKDMPVLLSEKTKFHWKLQVIKLLFSAVLVQLGNVCSVPAVLLWAQFAVPFGFRYYGLFYFMWRVFVSGIVFCTLTVALKWLFIGRPKAGRYTVTLYSESLRWILGVLSEIGVTIVFEWHNYTLYSLWLRINGAQFGKLVNVAGVRLGHIADASFFKFGDYSLANGSSVFACDCAEGYSIDRASPGSPRLTEQRYRGFIELKSFSQVAMGAAISADATVGFLSVLGAKCILPRGATLPDNTTRTTAGDVHTNHEAAERVMDQMSSSDSSARGMLPWWFVPLSCVFDLLAFVTLFGSLITAAEVNKSYYDSITSTDVYIVSWSLLILVTVFASCAFKCLLKWIIIGRLTPCTYGVRDVRMLKFRMDVINFRSWIRFFAFLIKDSVWLNVSLVCGGASVSLDALIVDSSVVDEDLITIGHWSVVDRSTVLGHMLDILQVCHSPMTIGPRCVVQPYSHAVGCSLSPGCRLGFGARFFLPGQETTPGALYVGVPAEEVPAEERLVKESVV